MTSPLLQLALTAVRVWTRVYTWGMEPLARDGRRAEIESDLWESLHDEAPSDAAIASAIFVRLLTGLYDDVRWRAEQPTLDARLRVTLGIAGASILVVGLWILLVASPGKLPIAPPAPVLSGEPAFPWPPPPPPPPRPRGRQDSAWNIHVDEEVDRVAPAR